MILGMRKIVLGRHKNPKLYVQNINDGQNNGNGDQNNVKLYVV